MARYAMERVEVNVNARIQVMEMCVLTVKFSELLGV